MLLYIYNFILHIYMKSIFWETFTNFANSYVDEEHKCYNYKLMS